MQATRRPAALNTFRLVKTCTKLYQNLCRIQNSCLVRTHTCLKFISRRTRIDTFNTMAVEQVVRGDFFIFTKVGLEVRPESIDDVHNNDPARQVQAGTRVRLTKIFSDGYVQFFSKEHNQEGIARIDELAGFEAAFEEYARNLQVQSPENSDEADIMKRLNALKGDESSVKFDEQQDLDLELPLSEISDPTDLDALDKLGDVEKARTGGMADETLIAADEIQHAAVTSTPKNSAVATETPKAPKPDKPRSKRNRDELEKSLIPSEASLDEIRRLVREGFDGQKAAGAAMQTDLHAQNSALVNAKIELGEKIDRNHKLTGILIDTKIAVSEKKLNAVIDAKFDELMNYIQNIDQDMGIKLALKADNVVGMDYTRGQDPAVPALEKQFEHFKTCFEGMTKRMANVEKLLKTRQAPEIRQPRERQVNFEERDLRNSAFNPAFSMVDNTRQAPNTCNTSMFVSHLHDHFENDHEADKTLRYIRQCPEKVPQRNDNGRLSMAFFLCKRSTNTLKIKGCLMLSFSIDGLSMHFLKTCEHALHLFLVQ